MTAQFLPLVVSAPSKVILHGEHAVVYGKTAVAASLDLRTRMTIKPHLTHVVVNFPDVGLSDCWTVEQLKELFKHRPTDKIEDEVDMVYLDKIHDFLGTDQSNLRMASVICFLYLYSVMVSPDIITMEIHVESEIPLGAGLGSSAALSVCLSAGLTGVLHQVKSLEKNIFNHLSNSAKKDVCRLAFLSEKILHGTPSGIDNSVSTYGGLCKFSDGVLTPLPTTTTLSILLVNTNVERNTKDLVNKVRLKYDSHPKIIKPVLESIDGVSEAFLALLENMGTGNSTATYHEMEELIDYNQALLQSLGVSHSALQDICNTVRQFGMHGKLTGAGGGGFAFALVPPNIPEKSLELARQTLEGAGYTCCSTQVGGAGVRISIQDNGPV